MLGQRAHVAVVEVQAGRAARRTRRRCDPPGSIWPAPRPGTPSIAAGWMPWKWIVCGCSEPLTKRDPQPLALARAQRRAGDAAVVGPGRRSGCPGATSISLSAATSVHSRTTRPLASRCVVPQSKSRRIVVWVEAVGGVVDVAAVERRVAALFLGSVAGVRVGRLRLGLPRVRVRDRGVQPGPGESDRRHTRGQQSASCQTRHELDCDMAKSEVQTGSLARLRQR